MNDDIDNPDYDRGDDESYNQRPRMRSKDYWENGKKGIPMQKKISWVFGIVWLAVLAFVIYMFIDSGYSAMDSEVSKYDIQRKERTYNSVSQYEEFIKNNQERVEK